MSSDETELRQNEILEHGGQPRYLDQEQASKYLEEKGLTIAPKTLGKLRVIGGGPAYRKFGRKPIYAHIDLDEWANAKVGPLRHSTSTTPTQLPSHPAVPYRS
jgi:hypothetical protein